VIASADQPAATVLVLMALAAIAVGATMYVLGALGLGRLVRYVPFPVIAGFLAGTGVVIGRSTIELLDVGIAGDATGGTDRLLRFAAGAAVSIALVVISRSRLPTERVLPVVVIGAIVASHTGLAVAGVGRAEGAARGFLLPEIPEGPMVRSESFTFFIDADWGVVAEQVVGVLPLVVLAPLTLLLYLGSLEAIVDVDLDIDREFRTIGAVNVVSAAAGSPPSYTQFAATNLIQQMPGARRAIPVVVGLAGLVAIALGDQVVALVPQPIVAGLLGFIALSFIVDWLWDTWRRMTRVEWLLAAGIALSITVFGFLPGVGLGIALTAGWFIVQYSRVSGIRRLRDATYLHSNVERSHDEVAQLEQTGRQVVIADPEGFLFFGTGDSIVRQVTERIDAAGAQFVILDFTMVTGADSSAAAALGQLVRWARRRDVEVIWCGVRAPVRRTLAALPVEDGSTEEIDLDRALEVTERARLAGLEGGAHRGSDLLADLADLSKYARPESFVSGDALFRSGETGPGLMIVVDGWAEVVGAPGARRRRVGPGSILGEIGLVHDGAATATVIADTDVEVMLLDREASARMADEAPRSATLLFRHLARSLSHRLLTSDAEIASFRTVPSDSESATDADPTSKGVLSPDSASAP
jgi:SulP family sulfate permease